MVEIAKLVTAFCQKWFPKPASRSHVYIRDNGGIPFHISINESTSLITVKKKGDCLRCWKPWNKWVYFRVWAGQTGSFSDEGSSVVFEKPEREFVWIGSSIYSFSLPPQEDILDFRTPIGNHDVPYPFLVGSMNTYLMAEKVCAPTNIILTKENPYLDYYLDENLKPKFHEFQTTRDNDLWSVMDLSFRFLIFIFIDFLFFMKHVWLLPTHPV